MSKSKFLTLDQKWLQEIIADKERHVAGVNGALMSEVMSDLFVLGSSAMALTFAFTNKSMGPVIEEWQSVVQLGCAVTAIKALINQRTKMQNDLHVLKAILEMDEETPENITEMLHDYIEIHADPEAADKPHSIEIKKLNYNALSTIRKNFRTHDVSLSLVQKAFFTGQFLKSEIGNAFGMMFKTAIAPVEMVKSIFTTTLEVGSVLKNRQQIKKRSNDITLYEKFSEMHEEAQQGYADEVDADFDKFFAADRKKQLLYLHQQEVSLRTVSRLRLETTLGIAACTAIIGFAASSLATTASLGVMAGGIYTILASLPSLKVLGQELASLNKISDRTYPKVKRAAADYLLAMPKAQPS